MHSLLDFSETSFADKLLQLVVVKFGALLFESDLVAAPSRPCGVMLDFMQVVQSCEIGRAHV